MNSLVSNNEQQAFLCLSPDPALGITGDNQLAVGFTVGDKSPAEYSIWFKGAIALLQED
jgi:hypothetical protein